MNPVLSIITINFNNKAGLEKTILSLERQTERSFEFIIIDGGSNDGSEELIDQHEAIVSYSVCEKDRGIYDAQNKGIGAAKGEYLLFLNSGDTLFDETVVATFLQFIHKKAERIVYGNSSLINKAGSNEELKPPPLLNKYYFFKSTLNHQACFISSSLFRKFGLYDLNYRICADFDFLFKVFCKIPECYCYFDKVICTYNLEGFSSVRSNYNTVVKEKQEILKKYLSKTEYLDFYKKAMLELPLKYQFLNVVYKIPFLGAVIKKTLTWLMPGEK